MTKNEITAIIRDAFKQAVAFAKAEGWVRPNWTCDLRIDPSDRRTRSWGGTRGGQPFISLAIASYVKGKEYFVEYASYAADPVIGSVKGSVEKSLRALVMHELTHAFQFSGSVKAMAGSNQSAQIDVRGHGALFKQLYRQLRVKFVNDVVAAPVDYVDYTVTPVPQKVQEAPEVTITRQEAFVMISKQFAAGTTASSIIRLLVNKGMKKTTATTYVYQIKSKHGF